MQEYIEGASGLLQIEDCLNVQGDIALPPGITLISLIERNIANVGDQPSDLAGGYAERTFLLPNPFYRIH